MQYNKDIHHRRSIRLKDYDYSQTGAYFVTVCSWNKGCVFGDIADGALQMNECGQTVQDEWMKTVDIRTNVELDEFAVMPNHIHGIIVLVGARRCLALNVNNEFLNGAANRQCKGEAMPRPYRREEKRATHRVAPTLISGSVGAIVGQFKSTVTKRINEIHNTPGRPVWQRNYYEHIIRDEDELNRIREYIINNPARWAEDENNPINWTL